MKERPIIFTTELIPKILDRTKTQTRRVIKPQPKRINGDFDGTWEWKEKGHYYDDLTLASMLKENCPHGQVGDRLWVRETWAEWINTSEHLAEGVISLKEAKDDIIYKADCPTWYRVKANNGNPYLIKSAMFMPRWASRITLEITGIRVERLQDITVDDVIAEGIYGDESSYEQGTPQMCFEAVWNSLNAKRGHPWDNNDWVWVIDFKKL